MLYTDGVSETRDPAGEFFQLTAWADDHPRATTSDLHLALRQHSANNLTDDIAVLAVRRE
uniref:SpoIIE family protein phosphatase n=1 Tax=Streptacidiphilus fuscans TaxID=2789292 RepID=UPI0022A7DCFD|nr:SpoIIE family protein phosphatase [Streptacidiphilus fuscans]